LANGEFEVAFEIMKTSHRHILEVISRAVAEGENTSFIYFWEYYVATVGKTTVIPDKADDCGCCVSPLLDEDDGKSVMLDSGGKPFLKKVATLSRHLRAEKGTDVTVGLSDSDKEIMRANGMSGDMVHPPTNPQAIEDAMRSNAAEVISGDFLPSTEEFDFIIGLFMPDASSKLTLPNGYKDMSAVCAAFEAKSSGISAMWRNVDKRKMFDLHPNGLLNIIFMRMLLRIAAWRELGTMTPHGMHNNSLSDPKDMFIKKDTYSPAKAKTKRFRCIWNVSCVDNALIGYTIKKPNRNLVYKYQSGDDPLHASGMGHHDEGLAQIGSIVEKWPAVYSEDASGWDWSVQRSTLMATEAVACGHYDRGSDGGVRYAGFCAVMTSNYLTSSFHLAAVGNDLWEGQVAAIVCSGSVDTTFNNNTGRTTGAQLTISTDDEISSFVSEVTRAGGAQLWMADSAPPGLEIESTDPRAALRPILENGDQLTPSATPVRVKPPHRSFTLGDDLLTSTPLDAKKARGYGTRSRDAVQGDPKRDFVFTSHNFLCDPETGVWTAKFLNTEKSISRMMLQKSPPTAEQLLGLKFAVRHTPEAQAQLAAVALAKGWEVPETELEVSRDLAAANFYGFYN
jgi:hypothetical protein